MVVQIGAVIAGAAAGAGSVAPADAPACALAGTLAVAIAAAPALGVMNVPATNCASIGSRRINERDALRGDGEGSASAVRMTMVSAELFATSSIRAG